MIFRFCIHTKISIFPFVLKCFELLINTACMRCISNIVTMSRMQEYNWTHGYAYNLINIGSLKWTSNTRYQCGKFQIKHRYEVKMTKSINKCSTSSTIWHWISKQYKKEKAAPKMWEIQINRVKNTKIKLFLARDFQKITAEFHRKTTNNCHSGFPYNDLEQNTDYSFFQFECLWKLNNIR